MLEVAMADTDSKDKKYCTYMKPKKLHKYDIIKFQFITRSGVQWLGRNLDVYFKTQSKLPSFMVQNTQAT